MGDQYWYVTRHTCSVNFSNESNTKTKLDRMCLLKITPCARVLLEKLMVPQLIKKLPTFYET